MNEIGSIVSESLNKMAEDGFIAADIKDGDYIGEDNLLYCGKCKTRKERFIMFPPGTIHKDKNTEKKIRCICKCEQEAIDKRKRDDEYREKMASIQRIRDSSMMDSKYKDAQFSLYKLTDHNQKAFHIARKYTNHFSQMLSDNQGIIFWGTVGTGKSFTAACIANELMSRNIPVVMTSFVKILQNLPNQNESEYIAALNRASLLILDDLGTERNTDYALEKVYNVIDSRSREAKPMILTTNMTLDEMLGAEDIRYKRIYDRIFETCLPVEVPGESFRKISADERFNKMAQFMEE